MVERMNYGDHCFSSKNLFSQCAVPDFFFFPLSLTVKIWKKVLNLIFMLPETFFLRIE